MKQSPLTFFRRAALVTLFAVVGVAAAGSQSIRDHVGKPLPKFSLKDLKGTTHTNTSLRGKVVLLDFWATWCGPCNAAKPTMQRLHTTLNARGLRVIGANTSETENLAGLKSHVAKSKLGYAITPNSDDLARSLRVRGLPTFVLVNKQGNVHKVWSGWSPAIASEIESEIKALLGS